MTLLAKTRKIAFWASINVALIILILALVEGLASLGLFVHKIARTPTVGEGVTPSTTHYSVGLTYPMSS